MQDISLFVESVAALWFVAFMVTIFLFGGKRHD